MTLPSSGTVIKFTYDKKHEIWYLLYLLTRNTRLLSKHEIFIKLSSSIFADQKGNAHVRYGQPDGRRKEAFSQTCFVVWVFLDGGILTETLKWALRQSR